MAYRAPPLVRALVHRIDVERRRDHRLLLSSQCRAARALLNWTLADLAEASLVSLSTAKHFEGTLRTTTVANVAAIVRALEKAGVEFIPAKNGKGVGVRMREG